MDGSTVSVSIISSSIRKNRKSHRVVLYLKKFIETTKNWNVNIIDLEALDLPLFHERLKYLEEPPAIAHQLSDQIHRSHAVIIVTPEYNGGYPASLKNLIDLLYDEWHRKPVAISTVSSGPFGGSQVITALQFTLWKMRAWTVPAMFPVPDVETSFNEAGESTDSEKTGKRAQKFVDEILWCVEASRKMK